MDYIGMTFNKKNYDGDLYTQVARWCNETQQARIVEQEDCYKVVAIPASTLEDLRTAKLAELGAAFNQRVAGTIDAHDYWMQFDIFDALKMQGAITLMEAVGSTTGYITQANDVTVYGVPIETMKQVLVEMLNAYAQCHARKQELRTLINNAQTKEELDEITISWPI